MNTDRAAPRRRRHSQAPSSAKIEQYLSRIASEMWTWLVNNRVFPSNSTGFVLQMAISHVGDWKERSAIRLYSAATIQRYLAQCHPRIRPNDRWAQGWEPDWERAILHALYRLLPDGMRRYLVLEKLWHRYRRTPQY